MCFSAAILVKMDSTKKQRLAKNQKKYYKKKCEDPEFRDKEKKDNRPSEKIKLKLCQLLKRRNRERQPMKDRNSVEDVRS